MARTAWHRTTLILLLLVATWLRVHQLVDLPPGLHYDEAANGILASEIAFAGFRPIFITSYTGKEVLYFYIAGGLMRLLGDSIFVLRLASAFIGLLTIAVSYWFAVEATRTLTPASTKRTTMPQLVGIITAILLATHFPHLIFSRLGFRAISQPLLQALTVATLLYALRTSRQNDLNWRAFALGGIWLGLAAYTYLAVRLFPFVIVLAMLPLLRQAWRGLVLMLGTASIVLLPFATFFVRNPETFWVRISQVSETQPTASDYANSFGQSIGILLGISGDPYWRFNNPDQPFFSPLLAALFVGGLLWIIWQQRKQLSTTGRAISILLIATPVIMILPTALALGEIVPSNLRAIGVYPFVLLPIALLIADGAGRVSQSNVRLVGPLALLLLFGTLGYSDYFGRWGVRADTYYDSDSDLIGAARYIDTQPTPTYVAALHYRHPTVAFASERYNELKWLVNSEAVVFPPHDAQVIYPHNSPPSNWTRAQLGEPVATEAGIDGATLFNVYQLPLDPPTPSIILDANFSNVIRLLGYDAVDENTPTPTIRLYWQVLATSDRPFAPFVHLIDETDFRWAQRETNAYPAEQWAVGETIVQEVTFDLPPGMPFAEYTAVVGLFDGHDRLPIVDDGGRFAGMTVQIESLLLAGNASEPVKAANVIIDGPTPLVGYQLDATSAETGTQLPLTLHWQLAAPQPYAVQLTNEDSTTTIADNIVQLGSSTNRYAIDRVFPQVPVEMTAGRYQLVTDVGGQAIALGAIEVVATERLFERPAVLFSAEIPFGDDIQLVGYDLSSEQTLTLVWQAQNPPPQDYTIFVHVLDNDGTCCLWQQDTQPQQGGYPTSRWIAGEYVIDQYQIALDELAPITSPIEIGIYLGETGERLRVGDQDYWILTFE